MAKCVCIGTDPVAVMEVALAGHDIDLLSSHWDGPGKLYICAKLVDGGGWTCSRQKGHEGPCVACESNGVGGRKKHNLTGVKL